MNSFYPSTTIQLTADKLRGTFVFNGAQRTPVLKMELFRRSFGPNSGPSSSELLTNPKNVIPPAFLSPDHG